MLHGRGGPYSANVEQGLHAGVARQIVGVRCERPVERHMMWGQYWAERGYVALRPDSFGPRGKAHGFGRFTDHPDRATG